MGFQPTSPPRFDPGGNVRADGGISHNLNKEFVMKLIKTILPLAMLAAAVLLLSGCPGKMMTVGDFQMPTSVVHQAVQ